MMGDPAGPDPERAIEPFLAVRERLGTRADGQVGRALRRRLIAAFVGTSFVFGAILYLFGWLESAPLG